MTAFIEIVALMELSIRRQGIYTSPTHSTEPSQKKLTKHIEIPWVVHNFFESVYSFTRKGSCTL